MLTKVHSGRGSLLRESAMARKGLGIPVPKSGGELCALHVLPLARAALHASVAPGAAAAIFVALAGQARGMRRPARSNPQLHAGRGSCVGYDCTGHSAQSAASLLGVGVRTYSSDATVRQNGCDKAGRFGTDDDYAVTTVLGPMAAFPMSACAGYSIAEQSQL